MRHGIFIPTFLFVSFLSINVLSQQPVFKTYTVNDGLVANSVRRIFQDGKGMIWIATWEGLSRYDGNTFTNYTSNNGLSHNVVNDFLERNDQLFISLNNGDVDLIKNGRIIGKFSSGLVVNRFITGLPGRILAGTDYQGLQELKANRFVKPAQAFPDEIYYGLAPLNGQLIAAITPYSLQVLDLNFQPFTTTQNNPPTFYHCLYRDAQQRVWVGTASGLRLLAPTQKAGLVPVMLPLPNIFNALLSSSVIHDILQDDEGTFWFATDKGLVMITSSGTATLYDKRHGLPSSEISTVFLDSEKNLWIGTSLGLARLITSSRIMTYGTDNGLSTDYIPFILQLGVSKMIVGSKGLQVIDVANKKFSPVYHADKIFDGFVTGSEQPILKSGNGLWRLFNEGKTLKAVDLSPQPSVIAHAVRDTKGNFFIANDQHLLVYNSAGILQDSLSLPLLNLLQFDDAGQLWAGTRTDGLYILKYNRQLKHVGHYLKSKHIRSLFRDREGNIWAGTRYDGLFRLQNQHDSISIKQYTQSIGLSSAWIRTINQTNDGAIWIGFYQGLDKLIPSGSDYRIFNFSRINNFYTSINQLVPAGKKQLWVATAQGLTHITDGSLELLKPKRVYITSVHAGDSLLPENDSGTYLRYDQNQLQFSFTSPTFINEKQVMYSYRLQNASWKWSEPSNLHTVSFANLRPGDYVFEVRSLGWNGQWGAAQKYPFSIAAPFWLRPLFLVSLSVLAAACTILLVRRRIKNVRRHAELRQRITEKEMLALRAQMNPHFIFNSLSSIDNLVQNDEKEKATVYLSRFARLLRAILENSGFEIIPVWKDLEMVKLYLDLELLRSDNSFSYSLDVEPALIQGDFKIPPMVIQPFVENAIHHGLLNKRGNNRKLWIRGRIEAGDVVFEIEDNGVGLKKAKEFRQLNKPGMESMGIAITRGRIELNNGHSIADSLIISELTEAGDPRGTRVTIRLKSK